LFLHKRPPSALLVTGGAWSIIPHSQLIIKITLRSYFNFKFTTISESDATRFRQFFDENVKQPHHTSYEIIDQLRFTAIDFWLNFR